MDKTLGKTEIIGLLKESGVPFAYYEHEAAYTMEDIERLGITRHGTICKNLFLRDASGKRHFLVSVSGEQKVDLKHLSQLLGSSRLSFASAERLQKHLGVTQGSVSPLCCLNDETRSVVMVFDTALKGNPSVGVHPCDNTASVFLSFEDLKSIIEWHGNPVMFVTLR